VLVMTSIGIGGGRGGTGQLIAPGGLHGGAGNCKSGRAAQQLQSRRELSSRFNDREVAWPECSAVWRVGGGLSFFWGSGGLPKAARCGPCTSALCLLCPPTSTLQFRFKGMNEAPSLSFQPPANFHVKIPCNVSGSSLDYSNLPRSQRTAISNSSRIIF
jgi:hypothetical protein